MTPYLTDRSTAYKKYTTFLFNSLKTKTQPIPRRRLSEMFNKGRNIRHYTRMDYNFNTHVVPLIICHSATWEEKAHLFFLTATPVLGAELKAKFEMIGTLELDGNSRMARFDSANFSLQRNESHTAYHKPMSDKAKRENTKVQDEAFEKFMGQINENNAALDFNNDEMNKSTSHLRQEVLKFLMMFLNFLGQRFPAVKATIAQVAEKVIQFDDYYDANLTLSAVSVQLCVINFVDSLTLDNNNSQHGPEIKSVLETLKNLLKNERNLHLVHDSLEEFLQEKFNSMDHNRKISAENLCHALDVMIEQLKGRRTNDQANVDHTDMDPMEFARPLVDNENVDLIEVGNAAADPMNDANDDPMGVDLQEEEDREAFVPVEDAGQLVDNDNADPIQVDNEAANPMNDANDDPMGVHREVEQQDALNLVEVARPQVNDEMEFLAPGDDDNGDDEDNDDEDEVEEDDDDVENDDNAGLIMFLF